MRASKKGALNEKYGQDKVLTSWMDEAVCLTVTNSGMACAGKPQARFDEGVMDDQLGGHVVAACGEAFRESFGR
jgi:hypothetical protein